MLILAIETSTPQVGVALVDYDGVLASFHANRDRRHAETVVPAVEFLFRQAGVGPSDLGAVAVDVGPGLFTGLRVGLATAKTMAQSLRIPMVGVSSLDLLAFAARMSDRRIVATVDARRGEVFAATYRRVHGGVQRLTEPVVASPDEVAGLVAAVRAWVDGGVDPGDIGVAARTKTILGAAEKELRSAGIQARQLEDGKEEGAVALGTMHRMKGMEFRAVAVVDAGADRLPLPVAVTQASVDQLQHDHDLQRERCLVYVACTRARDTLRVSWTGKASPLLLVT